MNNLKTIKILISCILCASLISLGCASPLPDSPITLSWTASSDESHATGYNVWKSIPGNERDWVMIASVPISQHSVELVKPLYGTVYCLTLTNSVNGIEGPMSEVVTNLNLGAADGALNIHR